MLAPRRTRTWIWAGRLTAIAILTGLIAYLAHVGLDTANKLNSSISVVIALVALIVPHLLPAPEDLDCVEDSGTATATAGGRANTGLQATGWTGSAQVMRAGRDIVAGHDIAVVSEQQGTAEQPGRATRAGSVHAVGGYVAYPELTAPAVVVAEVPFEVAVGLRRFYDPGTAVAGPVMLERTTGGIELEVELVVDPKSFAVESAAVVPLRVTTETPYPTGAVRLTARTDPSLLAERTIRLLIRREGSLVGIASRNLVVVGSPNEVTSAPRPAVQPTQMLSLAPLLGPDAPDLVVGVFAADERDENVYVWDAYPLGGMLQIPDGRRRGRINASARDFATYTSRAVSAKNLRGLPIFDHLKGYGDLVQAQIPLGIRQVLRHLVKGRDAAPTVLFLTEEPFVPWELAVLDPPLETLYGGNSPFLGAHLAMSRWPFMPDREGPTPAPQLAVARQGLLTAEYEGVEDWARLPAAEAEARKFDLAYGPTTKIMPRREDVVSCLDGRTPLDLLHIALHGQHDPTAQEDGLVLLEPDGSGGSRLRASFLTAAAVRGFRNRATTPFVFLNACQVGAGESLLGSYAGFAAAVLRTGAIGVIAPTWSIDDDVAGRISTRFYQSAYADPPVPVAEILRQIRADYTRDGVAGDPMAVTPTLVAYQFFGHPRLTLRRTGLPAPPPVRNENG